MKRLVPRKLYGLQGNRIEAQFTIFKADLFANGVAVPVLIGTSAAPITRTYTQKTLQAYTTCSSTNGGTSFEPVRFNTVMTGAGQVGGRVMVNMETNVVLGGWANALKALVDCKTNGRATGLLSAFCCEIVAPSASGAGTIAPLEIEFTTVASYTASSSHSFIYSKVGGDNTATTSFLSTGNLWHLEGMGSASSASKIFHTTGTVQATHGLRIRIGVTNYDILLKASTYA